jgi:hypothetical protein
MGRSQETGVAREKREGRKEVEREKKIRKGSGKKYGGNS